MRSIRIDGDFDPWREQARLLLSEGVEPSEILWTNEASPALFDSVSVDLFGTHSPGISARVPAEFVEIARLVACHRDESRWGLLYRALWRLTHGEPHLLELASDPDVVALNTMHRAVRRDRHKMTAFVRFRRAVEPADGAEHFIAWHRPEHFIVKLTAPFFAERFATMRWTILTPDDSVAWDGHQLCFGPGVPARDAPRADELEELWKTYYASIFNPARIKLDAMRKEMPLKHWRTLPETAAIPELLRDAPRRLEDMVKRTSRSTAAARADGDGAVVPLAACENTGDARDFFPSRLSLPQLREASKNCRGCDLYCNATQTVFGEGAAHAPVMFVGEQPGDQEDLAGKPFVGPSGQLLDSVLEEVGIDRKHDVFVTNAVKHFKFEPRGKRRIHSKPNAREVSACRPWLEAEIHVVKPKMIVCLGATAAQSLLGSGFRVTKHRGEVIEDQPWAPWMLATYHPSALLRMPDKAMKERARIEFRQDLAKVARQIARLSA